jgi:thiol:disulfide interchange protein DsbD
MNDVKRLFGLLLLGVGRVDHPAGAAGLRVARAVGRPAAGHRGRAVRRPRQGACARGRRVGAQALAAIAAIFGLLQLVGAASGGTDPLQPLAHLAGPRGAAADQALAFTPVRSVAELDAALKAAQQSGRAVMLDFYADWCVSCKEMERFTFSDAAVRARLSGAVLLKADVTKNNADDRELLKRFQLFGPPERSSSTAGPRSRRSARHRLPEHRSLPRNAARVGL